MKIASESVVPLFELPDRNIPYVTGGMTLQGMDCVGLLRYWFKQNGIDCPYRNTHDFLRKMTTTFEPIKPIVPVGSACWIVEDGRPLPARYGNDTSYPFVSHVYVKIGDGTLLHASASNNKVLTRAFQDKPIPNGGPTMYSLVKGLTYGDKPYAGEPPGLYDDELNSEIIPDEPMAEEPESGECKVVSGNGKGVVLRKYPRAPRDPSTAICTIPEGTILAILDFDGGFTQAPYIDKYGTPHKGWVNNDFLQFGQG